jgi:outer membrane beta-barrel protein
MKFQFLLLAFVLLNLDIAYSAKIQFPDEELASESVLPVFDDPQPVKNRNVVTAKKIEITGFLGVTMNEPFTDPYNFGGMLTYHFNEFHAIQLYGTGFAASENDYPEQINNETGGDPVGYDIRGKVAKPEAALLLSYKISPYYGKFSLTKQGVLNIAIYGTLGLGTIQISGEQSPVGAFGLGQKFYFSKNFSLVADLRILAFNGPDPRGKIEVDPDPGTVENGDRFQLKYIFTVGAAYIF